MFQLLPHKLHMFGARPAEMSQVCLFKKAVGDRRNQKRRVERFFFNSKRRPHLSPAQVR
jgi:hypothetical protein